MPNHLTSLATIYNFNTAALQALAAKFRGDDWLKRIAPKTSTAYWIVGHLATYRCVVFGAITGEATPPPWEGKFMRDTQSPEKLDPSPAQLVAELTKTGPMLTAAMVELTARQLAADCGRPIRSGDTTVEGMLQFIQFHEGYHIGQLGLIAKGLGKPPLVTPGS